MIYIYDRALIKGHGGYLLDQERPNIFTLSVGNLNPGSEVLVEIEYATLLDGDGETVRFFLPTTISPRYIQNGAKDDSGIPVDGKLHSPYATDVPYGLSVSLNIHEGSQLKAVDSPSHHIRIENMKADPVRVSFSSDEVRMDRDFVLSIVYEEAFKSRAYHHRFENESFLQLDLLLDQDDVNKARPKEVSREIVFVLDCSGSMGGDSIEQAKRALEICLRGLPQGVGFNLCRFGSRYEFMFKRSEKYSETTLNRALGYLHRVDADLGGTAILAPLKGICSKRNDSRQDIILLTDGQVSNEQEIFELIREHRAHTRVFPVGIGAGCNEHFNKGLARAGNGASEFIYPGERIEPKVLSLFGKVGQAGLENPLIAWGAGEAEQAPVTPAIFLDSPVTVFARTGASDFTGKEVEVKGKINGTERRWRIPVLEAPNDNLPIPVLWARERVRDLEESGEFKAGRGSRQAERKKESREKTILEICRRFGILSQSTSYVAVEEREEKNRTTGEIELRKIPVLVTIGWHGVGSTSGRFALSASQPIVKLAMADSVDYGRVFDARIAKDHGEQMSGPRRRELREDSMIGYGESFETQVDERQRELEFVFKILTSQRAEGGIMLDERLSGYFGLDYEELQHIAEEIEVTVRVDKFLLLSTAIALKVLETRFGALSRSWLRMAQKSKEWVMDVVNKGAPGIRGRDLTAWVDEFVRRTV
ncbi:MAG: VIT and VWA domain-containing protein [Desulfobacterota bacterium]|nr:VIT and VWA domain-containing protein [Thermodesulfobacteriota bacterium]